MKRLIKPALEQKTFRKVKFHRSLSSVRSVSSDVIMASHYISVNILSICTTCCIRRNHVPNIDFDFFSHLITLF